MIKLKEKHIINSGGVYYTDKYNTEWIFLQQKKEGRSTLSFLNTKDGFNLYLIADAKIYTAANPAGCAQSVHFCFLKRWLTFKLLCFVFNYR